MAAARSIALCAPPAVEQCAPTRTGFAFNLRVDDLGVCVIKGHAEGAALSVGGVVRGAPTSKAGRDSVVAGLGSGRRSAWHHAW